MRLWGWNRVNGLQESKMHKEEPEELFQEDEINPEE
jgi:hypothetical protein